ncbi:MAG: class I SAM-dependent methyltransferase [Chitinophagales bacterium]|nr:class I SAM-dependent methyltransferase [Chitinophagales bacterium]MDW8419285.1 methyltransferase domain-containing protein [Chitinophagales bacterium]
MELKRSPFRGVTNIIRFNWHLYLCAGVILAILISWQHKLPAPLKPFALTISFALGITLIASLAVSYFIYDFSDLYQLPWLPDLNFKKVLNIHAGFDETSNIIMGKFPNTELTICDFYDKDKHTEISLRRARRIYPPTNNTIRVAANNLPFKDNTFDYSLIIFAAHEIRDKSDRVQFFKEIDRVTKAGGEIFLTEHLRDLNNFLAYSLGSLHFYAKSSWMEIFKTAGLAVTSEIKITPFITTFVLRKNGDTL